MSRPCSQIWIVSSVNAWYLDGMADEDFTVAARIPKPLYDKIL